MYIVNYLTNNILCQVYMFEYIIKTHEKITDNPQERNKLQLKMKKIII